jgi:hypothetical protein
MLVVLAGSAGLILILMASAIALAHPRLGSALVTRPSRWSPLGALTSLRERLVDGVGRWPAFAILLTAGYALTFLVGWLVGLGVSRLQDAIDSPVFNWIAQRRFTGDWSRFMAMVTQMGDRPVTRGVAVVCALSAVALASPHILCAALYTAMAGRSGGPTTPTNRRWNLPIGFCAPSCFFRWLLRLHLDLLRVSTLGSYSARADQMAYWRCRRNYHRRRHICRSLYATRPTATLDH